MASSSILYLVRAPEDKAHFCKCDPGIMNAPYHSTNLYPTGGEGWMFTCLTCSRGFDIAVARHIHESLDSLARDATPRIRKVLNGKTGEIREDVLMATPDDWLAAVRPLLTNLVENERYVFFDGAILPYHHGPVRFKGLYREHNLPDLPHLAGSPLSDILSNWDYWSGAPLDDVLAKIEAEARERQQGVEPARPPLWKRLFTNFGNPTRDELHERR